MHYRLLGRTGVTVSSLCFGAMSFGGDADEVTAAGLVSESDGVEPHRHIVISPA